MELKSPPTLTRHRLLARSGQLAGSGLLSSVRHPFVGAQTGAPFGAPDAYVQPKPIIQGSFAPTWESLRDNFRVPRWVNEARFGIFIHWGLYSLPVQLNEWYERHMYTTDMKWHTGHSGSPDKFGYKELIPMFPAKNYRPDEWVELFVKSGARYVVPVAEHHDGFVMYDSAVTPRCAGRMGSKRDLMGELATEVRKRNLIFGCLSHRMEHDSFAFPAPGVQSDEFDPKYAGFYGPPIPGEINNSSASLAFQEDWLARVQELVDKYQPPLLYFDNGVNMRAYDDVKLRAAAYYYNRATEWHKEATLATKDDAYLFGSEEHFEKQQRAPSRIYPSAGWQCDDALGNTRGNTTDMSVRSPESVIRELIEIASEGGNLLLNISPMGDGSIPKAQQQALLQIEDWLKSNGMATYGSRPWIRMGEGPLIPAEAPGNWKDGSTAEAGPTVVRRKIQPPIENDFRFPAGNGAVYAFGCLWPEPQARIVSFPAGRAKVERVAMLASNLPLNFYQTTEALSVTLPSTRTCSGLPYVLCMEGSLPARPYMMGEMN